MKAKILIILCIILIENACEKEKDTNFLKDERDGKVYNTVQIGDQTWMAENLNYKVTQEWGYNSEFIETYGYLYNWETACDVCPDGWHLPTDQEWMKLELSLGMDSSSLYKYVNRGTDESGKLKETDTLHWKSPNEGATDEFNFKALPAGCYQNIPGNYFIINTTTYAYFWTSSERDIDNAVIRAMTYYHSQITRGTFWKEHGCSVRCVKD